MSQHPSYHGRLDRAARAAAERAGTAESAVVFAPTRRHAERACCCAAPPAVIVIMPPANSRPGATDLLLCGHHYRMSKPVLKAASTTVLDINGCPLTGGDWPEATG